MLADTLSCLSNYDLTEICMAKKEGHKYGYFV